MSAQRQCLPERELGKKMMGFNWQHWAGWGAGHGGIPVQDQGWYLVTFPFSSGSVFSTRPWLCFPAALERQEIKSQRLLLTYLHFHVSIHYLHFQGGNLGSFTGMGNFSAEFTDISACHAHRDVFSRLFLFLLLLLGAQAESSLAAETPQDGPGWRSCSPAWLWSLQ